MNSGLKEELRNIFSASPQIIKEKFAKNTVEIFPLNFNTVAGSYSSRYLRPQGTSLTPTPAKVKYHNNVLKSLVKPGLWLLKVRRV